MKTVRSFLVALNLLLLTPSLLKAAGTIAGKVETPEEAFLGGQVFLRKNNCLIASADLQKDGSFSFSSLPKGSYTIVAHVPGFQTKALGTYVNDDQTNNLNFALKAQGCPFSGIVSMRNSEEPISEALVRIFAGYNLIAETQTDARGSFSFDDVPPGNYHLVVHSPLYQAAATSIVIKETMTRTIELKLAQNPGALTGTIIKKVNQKGIPGAHVTVVDGPVIIASTLTDMRGNFSLQGLPPGNYTVIAEADSYQAVSTGSLIEAGKTASAQLALGQKSCTIKGHIACRQSHEPLSAVIAAYNTKQIFVKSTLTDSEGLYTLDNLPPGKYNIIVNADHYQGQTKSSEGGNELDFALVKNPSVVSGIVVDEYSKEPVLGATLTVFDGPTFVTSLLTDEQGHYQFDNLSFGTYRIRVTYPLFQGCEHVISVSSGSKTKLDFALKSYPGKILGRVKDAVTGLPLESALISLEDHRNIQQTVLSDKEGYFALSGLMPGKYKITATAHSYQFYTKTITVYSSEPTTLTCDLTHSPGSVKGIIIDDDERPLAKASVTILQGETMISQSLTDEQGRYYLDNLQEGLYQIIVEAKTYQTSSSTVHVTTGKETENTITVKAKPACIKGIIVEALSGARTPDVYIILKNTKGYSKTIATDQKGNFVFDMLPPGTYTLETSAPKFETSTTSVKIGPEQETELVLSLMAQKASIAGDAVDAETNEALINAEITLWQEGHVITILRTNEAGHFSIFDLAPGSYSLVIQVSNYAVKKIGVTVEKNKTFSCSLPLVELASPLSLHGAVVLDRYLTTTDRIHSLSWAPSPSKNVVKYNLYRNGHFVMSFNANAPLGYDFHRQSGKEIVNYTVTALKESGEESLPVLCTLK